MVYRLQGKFVILGYINKIDLTIPEKWLTLKEASKEAALTEISTGVDENAALCSCFY